MTLSPAEWVIRQIGGVRATARAIGRSPSSISKWQRPRELNGSGGGIPSKARRQILEYAKKHALDISSEDLDYGRKIRKRGA